MRVTTAIRYVRWEARGARGRIFFFSTCLAIGVAVIVIVAGMSGAIRAGIRADARKLLAADLTISGQRTPPEEVEEFLASQTDLRLSSVRELVTMAATPATDSSPGASQLVELKAVGDGYPFYGQVETEPQAPLSELLRADSVLVAPELLSRLRLQAGDQLVIGGSTFVISGTVTREPDAFARMALGPRVLLSTSGLDTTGLEQLGSRVLQRRLVALPPEATMKNLQTLQAELKERLAAEPDLRVETFTEARPRLRRSVERAERYLGLVALLSLLLGGLGVAQTVRAWMASRLDAIAVVRCLGLRPREVLGIYLGQTIALASAASLLGAALGQAALVLIPGLYSDLLDPALLQIWQPMAVLRGFAFGVGVAVLFSAAPLLIIRHVPPLRVLRRDVEPPPTAPATRVVSVGLLFAGVLTAATIQSRSFLMGILFAVGFAGAGLLLSGAVHLGLRWLARTRRKPKSVWTRYGIAALARPGAGTVTSVVALGLGVLFVLATALVEVNLSEQLRTDLPADSPTAFLIDIQPGQWEAVDELLRTSGATQISSVPVVSARLRKVNGQSVVEMLETTHNERNQRWALTREQRLTYMTELPEDNRVVAGELWSDPLAAEVSIEQEFAQSIGVSIGSPIEIDVQGVPLALTVTSLRTVDWETYGINFFLVVEPGVLDDAPQVRLAAARLPATGEQAIQDQLAGSFPNVTLIRTRSVLEKIAEILSRLAAGVRLLGSSTVIAGIVILAGAVSTGLVGRQREIALLKTLGMTRVQVVGAYLVEFALIGAVAGTIGTAAGAILAWAVVKFGLDIAWSLHPGLLLAAIIGTVLLTTGTSLLTGWRTLRRRPLDPLRSG